MHSLCEARQRVQGLWPSHLRCLLRCQRVSTARRQASSSAHRPLVSRACPHSGMGGQWREQRRGGRVTGRMRQGAPLRKAHSLATVSHGGSAVRRTEAATQGIEQEVRGHSHMPGRRPGPSSHEPCWHRQAPSVVAAAPMTATSCRRRCGHCRPSGGGSPW